MAKKNKKSNADGVQAKTDMLYEAGKKKDKKSSSESFDSYPHLLEIKPKEQYIFHSDYFQVDNQFGCVMSFFHVDGSNDNFGAFWGIGKIPGG